MVIHYKTPRYSSTRTWFQCVVHPPFRSEIGYRGLDHRRRDTTEMCSLGGDLQSMDEFIVSVRNHVLRWFTIPFLSLPVLIQVGPLSPSRRTSSTASSTRLRLSLIWPGQCLLPSLPACHRLTGSRGTLTSRGGVVVDSGLSVVGEARRDWSRVTPPSVTDRTSLGETRHVPDVSTVSTRVVGELSV